MTAATQYGDTVSVINRTGIDSADLGLPDDDALTAYLSGLLDEVTDVFDRFMRLTYLGVLDTNGDPVPVPAGLNGIANDATAYMVGQQVASRQTPVVRIDDFRVVVTSAAILTPDIKDRLKLYSSGRGVVTVDIGQDIVSDIPLIYDASMLDGDLPFDGTP